MSTSARFSPENCGSSWNLATAHRRLFHINFAPDDCTATTKLQPPHDHEQVDRIYRRYLGTDHNLWPELFRLRLDDPAFALWTVIPTSGLAVAFPDFDVSELRWETPEQSPLP